MSCLSRSELRGLLVGSRSKNQFSTVLITTNTKSSIDVPEEEGRELPIPSHPITLNNREIERMFLQKLINCLLLVYFLFIAIVAPLFDGQTVLPSYLFPDFLLDLKSWHVRENSDYLVADKPDFFIGLIWVELFFQWPLAIANVYAIFTNKSWFRKTCLLYGVSTVTGMVAILSELLRSPKASSKLVNIYAPFIGFGVLAVLQGLLPHSAGVTKPPMARKKRA